MAVKTKAAKGGLKAVKAAPAKGKLAKGGLKLGRRKAERTPAGTAVLYTQALAGDPDARRELRDAFESARKAYGRATDRSGRPDLGALLSDRKAQKETGRAVESMRRALRLADSRRRKPRSAKGPALAVVVVVAAGVAASNEGVRARAAQLIGSDDGDIEDVPASAG